MRGRRFGTLGEDTIEAFAGAALVGEVVTEENLAVSKPPTLVLFSA